MSSVLRALRESDPGLIPILAQVWNARIDGLDHAKAVEAVSKVMRDPARAEALWEKLSDRERGALQVLASSGAKMQEASFERLFGKIRKMGSGQIARDQPHLNPGSVAEALFYRGLIALGYENANTGPRAIVFVPDDLLKVLPTRKTSYDNLADEPFDESEFDEDDEEEAPMIAAPSAVTSGRPSVPQAPVMQNTADTDAGEVEILENVANPRPADTSIVDDMTTLLAYLQLHLPYLEDNALSKQELEALMPFLLLQDRARLRFMVGVAVSARLIDVVGGRAQPNRAELRRWLGGTRSEQIRRLADAWRLSDSYVELWNVPGLVVEREAGTMNQYNAIAARDAMLDALQQHVPASAWWSIEDFIFLMREEHTDFQRPNSDFESWYIRDSAGDYLTGIESWSSVEGALLDYVLTGPMHWLGLLDGADDAARLTAYGRGFLGLSAFPSPADPVDKIDLQPDGTITVSRKIGRMDRFQVARFASWVSGADLGGRAYTYKLDATSIRRAAGQGIDTGHIGAFLNKVITPLPPGVARLLQNWQSGPAAAVTFEGVILIRTTSVETMNAIYETPATRRYLGARLGDLAAIIRADQWEALRDVLGEQGIQVEVMGI